MSPRNFARRFKRATGKTPLAYLQKLRVTEAKRPLEREYKTVQAIASEVGYDDLIFFRDLFKRCSGASPQACRETFGTRRPARNARPRSPRSAST